MRIQVRLWLTKAFVILLSAAIAFMVALFLRDSHQAMARSQAYDEVILKAFALSTLVNNLLLQPSDRRERQVADVLDSLQTRLSALPAEDAKEDFLLDQMRKNNDDLGPLLAQFLEHKGLPGNPMEQDRRQLLGAQVRIKARFITDDTARLKEYNNEHLLAVQDRTAVSILSLLAVLIVVNGGAFYMASRRVLYGMRALTAGAEHMTSGNLGYRIHMPGKDEFATLAQVFNHMAEALQKSATDQQRHAAKLEQSNRELEQFSYIASHDLQEPLRKIQAFSDAVQTEAGETLNARCQDYLRRMAESAGRMRSLINALLEYSRVMKRREPFTLVNLNAVLDEALGDLEVRIKDTGGRVEAGPLPAIMGDALQLHQLFLNLVGNALKYHRPDVPPVIRISAACSGTGQERICQIEVADNGIGIQKQYLDKIFVPFQRLHGRKEFEGTGIGLSICRMAAERHDGSITAHSMPDGGTTFVIRLPAAHPLSAQPADQDAAPASPPALPPASDLDTGPTPATRTQEPSP